MINTLMKLREFYRQLNFGLMAGLVFAAGSGIGSTLGLHALISASQLGETALGRSIAWLGAIMSCLIIQGLIVTKILTLAEGGLPKSRRNGHIILLILTWGFSILTAYGMWWFILSAEDYKDRVATYEVEQTLVPINTAATEFLRARNEFSLVASHANLMAEREDTVGDSCGYNAGTGKGNRYSLRKDQNSQAQKHAGNIEQIYDELSTTIEGLKSLNNEDMKSAYLKARKLLDSSDIHSAKQWMTAQKNGFSSGFVSKDRKLFRCEDSDMEELLANALAALEGIPAMGPNAPTRPDLSLDEAMIKSYGRVLKPIVMPFASQSTIEKPTARDFAPFLPPLLIEVIMSLLLWLSTSPKERVGPWKNPGESGLVGTRDPIMEIFEQALRGTKSSARTYDEVHNYIVHLRNFNRTFIAIPTNNWRAKDTALKVKAAILQIMSKKEYKNVLRPVAQQVSADTLPDFFKARVSWIKQDETIDLYEIPEEIFFELKYATLMDTFKK